MTVLVMVLVLVRSKQDWAQGKCLEDKIFLVIIGCRHVCVRYVNFCLMKKDRRCESCHAQVTPRTVNWINVHRTIFALVDSLWSRNSASRSCYNEQQSQLARLCRDSTTGDEQVWHGIARGGFLFWGVNGWFCWVGWL